MYEKTIAALLAKNNEIARKIPSIEESIKTYAQMTENYKRELDDMQKELQQNELVIKILKEDQ